MRKPKYSKTTINDILYSMSKNAGNISPCIISIDITGSVIIENFKKLREYTKDKIIVQSKEKIVYIFGSKLKITSCNKFSAMIKGEINKIEIFENEVTKSDTKGRV